MDLRRVYGEVILRKGTILYHTSDNKFRINPQKSFLFTTFHPSEWSNIDKYITRIILRRDVSLLFMVGSIERYRIYSPLEILVNDLEQIPGYHGKLRVYKYPCYADELKKQNFDGWFSSVQDRAQIEVALLNVNTIFSTEKSELYISSNCKNGNIIDNVVYVKDWGKRYPISILKPQYQPILKVHERYKTMFRRYIKLCYDSQLPFERIFHIILHISKIIYHKSPIKIKIRHWRC
jgi:hypothetical protein